MRRILKIFRKNLAVSIVVGASFVLSCAQPQPVSPPDGVVLPVHTSDLAILSIHATCVCPETQKVDAILFSDLEVTVANLVSSPTVADGVVKVTFRDLTTGTTRTESASFTVLHQGESRTIEVFHNPLLVDAIAKVRAEVEPIGSTDPDLTNNKREAEFDICIPPVL
jgi:hypothetical protein